MSFLFQGRLCGYICPECPEPLSYVTVKLYRTRGDQDVPALTEAQPKETFAILTPEQIEEKASYLLAEAETDGNGAFSFELGDEQDYAGGPFEIDVCLETVPGLEKQKKPAKALQFTLTTLQPRWRQTEDGYVAKWDHCLSRRLWCHIRGCFGAWVICGQVVTCDDKYPVAGVRVKACDVDWIQDDPLGEAVTDIAGKFRIDYTTTEFRRTPLSPLFNLEATEGPDVYFRIETLTGNDLLVEPRLRGRDPDRENVGPCFCVTLCLSKDIVPTPDPDTIPLFDHVGQYHFDSDPTLDEFAADGTTDAGGYAFTGTIPLIGILPDGTAADPVEYRFRYANHDNLGLVTNADASVIKPTIIGKLQYFAWNTFLSVWQVKSAKYWVDNPGAVVSIPQSAGPNLVVSVNKPVAADGWIEVPTENQLFPGGIGRFVRDSDRLANFDSRQLTDEQFDLTVAAPPLPLAAGDSVPAAQRSAAPKFRIFFEARKVSDASPVGANQLDKIALSNTRYTYERHPEWAGGTVTTTAVVSLRIAEMIAAGATGCDQMTDELHALWTAYHPYLGQVKLYFEGNPPLPADLLPGIAGGESAQGLPGHLFDISAMDPCAYILWMRATLNLSDGYGPVSNNKIWDKIAFCVS